MVIGAALNGLAAAVALGGANVRRPVAVTLVDANDPRQFSKSAFDGRASAITSSGRRMFEALGLWDKLAVHAEAMREIIVTDTNRGPAERPTFLQFETPEGSAPSAYMVENRYLYETMLEAAVASPHVTIRSGSATSWYRFGKGLASVGLADGSELKASLVVAADGKNSAARQAANIGMVGWDYDQMAIVVTVAHTKPHGGRAEEHFRPPGPFAILPLPGNYSSLVWNETKAEAQRILALADEPFLDELKQRFGSHLGEVTLASGRHGYPLRLSVAREFTSDRLALVGDAAHVVHPLAGLGFNLGLRDVAALAECVSDAKAVGLDIGSRQILDRYAAWRRFDTVATAAAMEGMNRLFSNDSPSLRLIRDAGLMAVNRLKPLKSAFMQQAAGGAGVQPKLLRGLMP